MKTSSGFKWTRLKQGFRDDQTGITWLPVEPGTHTHEKAVALQDKKKRLPTIGELRMAWEHGAGEVMEDLKEHWYWSSSTYSGYSNYAYVLGGQHGNIHDSNRDFKGAVRMVRE